jgi:hypothetical protein
MIRVVDAHYVAGNVLRVRFNDGSEGEVDLSEELWGEMFEPLRDPAVFRSFRVDPDIHTVVWPNGADFAPEFLREKVKVPA